MLVRVTDEERPQLRKKPATYQDVIDAPEHMVAEILDGELFLSPRPAPRHARATGRLASILDSAFDEGLTGPGGWLILGEPELHIGPDVVVPDVAGWKREHMPRLPKEAFFAKAPDWVCETLSPSTARIDRLKKLRIYARESVGWVWLVDPRARTLEVYRLDGSQLTLANVYGEDEVDRVQVPPFDAIEFQLSRLWRDVEITANGQP
jgi:Uma2 family endonuclease